MTEPHPQSTSKYGLSYLTIGLIYILINGIFVAKYAVDCPLPPFLITLIYVAGSSGLYLFSGRIVTRLVRSDRTKAVFCAITTIAIIGMIMILRQIDPAGNDVGRYVAITDWLDNLSHGVFPYFSASKPSGMPFLFLIAYPFHVLGDVGLLQVASFALFAFLLWHESSLRNAHRQIALTGLILLLAAPAFWFEVVTRSDLFANMVVGWGWLKLFDKLSKGQSRHKLILTGLLGGLVLATRTILGPIFIIYLVFEMRRMLPNYRWSLLLSMFIGFTAINLPFLIWEFDYFIYQGPLAVQAEQLPITALIIFLAGILYISFRIKSPRAIVPTVVGLLLMLVTAAMTIKIASFGFSDMLYGNQFDISYFCMLLPFLIIYFIQTKTINDATISGP